MASSTLKDRLASSLPPTLYVTMTPTELGAATDIIAAIYKGSSNKREYNKHVKSLTSVITQILAIRGKRLAKGAVLSEIRHSISLKDQEVQYSFQFTYDAQVVADAFA